MMPSAERFVKSCQRNHIPDLLRNLQTHMELLRCGEHTFPMTVNDGGVSNNCYLCNPITGYVDYALEETRHFVSNPLMQRSLIGLVRAASPMLRATGLDRAVHVNNWLFSTNPAPKIDRPLARALRDSLVARFPTHVIIMRSLNTYSDQATLEVLKAEGFVLLPSRQIYLFEGAKTKPPSRDMKRDLRLLTNSQLVRGKAQTPEDFARCVALYEKLYLHKYTPLNPQYTALFLAEMQQAGVLQLETLGTPDGEIVAFGGQFQYGRTLTLPLLGYDTARPQKEGLYRLITAMAQQQARSHGLLFNMSAGAAAFKRHRLAEPAIEYSAVYAKHLCKRQRAAIRGVASVLSRIGIPLLQRYKL